MTGLGKRVNAMEQSWSTWIDTGRSIFCRIESRRVCKGGSRRTPEWKLSAVIAHEFGLSRKTVRRFLRATEFPEQGSRRHRTGLEPYREYLEKRWTEGCHNASRLCRELQEKGYTGQRSRVKEFLQPWRSPEPKRN